MKRTLVIKFGGASVATPESFSSVCDIILARQREFPRIAIVVSAMGNTTNDLEALAKRVNPDPPRREYDMLVTVGERISISLLAMALAGKGCQAISFTGSQSGIITCRRHSNAQIIDVRPHRLVPHLMENRVIIVAGFQGVSQEGEITTLGRGGSDTTAVALGVALGAEHVEFFKDVQGVYESDPKCNAEAALLPRLDYDAALAIIRQAKRPILHPRCIELAKRNGLPLWVRSFNNFDGEEHRGTIIRTDHTRSPVPLYEEHQ